MDMKKATILLLLICILLPVSLSAGNFVTRYEKGSRLIERDGRLFVVNYNLEWPELLDTAAPATLSDTLSQTVFGFRAASLADALQKLQGKDGKRLAQMPDSPNLTKTYINATVQILWFEKGHYITLIATGENRNDTDTATTKHSLLFTYDLVNNKVISTKDIIRPTIIRNSGEVQQLYGLVTNCSNVDDNTLITWTKTISHPAVFSNSILFDLTEATEVNSPWQYSQVPISLLEQYYCTKQFRKWLKYIPETTTEGNNRTRNLEALGDTENSNDSIINHNSSDLTCYEGGYKALIAAISRHLQSTNNIVFPTPLCKTVISFVVEKDGSLSNVIVLQPINAQADRQIVSGILFATGWKRPESAKKPYRTRFTLPFTFSLKH